MHCMTHFVEQSFHFMPGQEARTISWSGEVANERDCRQLELVSCNSVI